MVRAYLKVTTAGRSAYHDLLGKQMQQWQRQILALQFAY